ncbi:MAG TPA: hypothetical protein ENI46_01570, partial [Firmicutes bacterium]|nr:hypothetical protein [Bacillota bacterium]
CAQEIVEAFGHSRFSRTFFTRLVRQFEERLEEFHRRALSNWPYVFIDGMAVRVWDSYLKHKVVIFAVGMDDDGRREVLGWVVADVYKRQSIKPEDKDLDPTSWLKLRRKPANHAKIIKRKILKRYAKSLKFPGKSFSDCRGSLDEIDPLDVSAFLNCSPDLSLEKWQHELSPDLTTISLLEVSNALGSIFQGELAVADYLSASAKVQT